MPTSSMAHAPWGSCTSTSTARGCPASKNASGKRPPSGYSMNARSRAFATKAADSQQRIQDLQEVIVEMESKAQQSHEEMLSLVQAVEAEERGMLEALKKLEEARKAAQEQLQEALERLKEAEEENRILAAESVQKQAKLEAIATSESEASALAQKMHECAKQAEAQARELRKNVERQQGELHERDKLVRSLEAHHDDMELKMQELSFELQELQPKMLHAKERYQDLMVRYQRLEAVSEATRKSLEACKSSCAGKLAAREKQHLEERQLLQAQMRAKEHELKTAQENHDVVLALHLSELHKEAQMRKEADARDEASRALVRELRRKLETSENQVVSLRRHNENLSQALNEKEHRLSQIVEEENGWQRRVRNLTDEALEREKLLKQSRTEVVALEGVLRQAYKIFSIQNKAKLHNRENGLLVPHDEAHRPVDPLTALPIEGQTLETDAHAGMHKEQLPVLLPQLLLDHLDECRREHHGALLVSEAIDSARGGRLGEAGGACGRGKGGRICDERKLGGGETGSRATHKLNAMGRRGKGGRQGRNLEQTHGSSSKSPISHCRGQPPHLQVLVRVPDAENGGARRGPTREGRGEGAEERESNMQGGMAGSEESTGSSDLDSNRAQQAVAGVQAGRGVLIQTGMFGSNLRLDSDADSLCEND